MIEVHHRPREIKIRYEGDDACIRRPHRRADFAGEVSPEVTTLDLSIQHPGSSEVAGDSARSRRLKRTGPLSRRCMGLAGNRPRLLDLLPDSSLGG
jgi:hypothetical protein